MTTAEPDVPHLSPDAFRALGREVVDWIARYHERVDALPVRSEVEPGAVMAAMPAAAPEHGEPFADVLRDLDRIVVPALTHWQSPGFFAYFPASTSGPSILGDLLCAGLGVQGMLWATSPACTEVETRVLDWLVPLLGLPDRFRSTGPGGGVIQDSASSATLCAILAARERHGLHALPRLVAYASEHAHSSVEKGLRIAGIPADRLRRIATDGEFALRPDALRAAIDHDRAAGLLPFFATATVGTTSSCAVDPVPAIGPVCAEHGVWLHVDAAYAGVAALCPEHRSLHDGLELADSYCTNAHKWLLTGFDCTCFWVADRTALIAALAVDPEYLRNPASAACAVVDYRDWQIPLGRRFRALKLWLVLRHYGAEGLRAHLRAHVAAAAWFAERVRGDDRFELAAPPRLGLVCFRLRAGDAATGRLLDALRGPGQPFLTHTRLDGRLTLRLALGGAHTRRQHVEAAWRSIATAAGAAR